MSSELSGIAKVAVDVGTTANEVSQSWKGDLPKAETLPASRLEGELPAKEASPENWDGALPSPENDIPEAPESSLGREIDLEAIAEEVKVEQTIPSKNDISPHSLEGEIYSKAGVNLENPVVENLQGRDYAVYILNNIDPELEGPDGRTNLERTYQGEAAYVDVNGKLEKVNLHHHEQKNDTLVEMPENAHQSNNDILHPNRGAGEGRGEDPLWNERRSEHWQNRGF